MAGVGYPASSTSELVAGIFARQTGITDPDIVLALNDRAEAIEQRAHELATIAIERGDAWVADFGQAPPTNELYKQWVLEIAAGAAILRRWSIKNADTILDDVSVGHDKRLSEVYPLCRPKGLLSHSDRGCTGEYCVRVFR